jgi:hypothetical protein
MHQPQDTDDDQIHGHEINELPRCLRRGINKEKIFNIAASSEEYTPERFASAQTERNSFSNSSATGPEEAGFWPVISLPSTWT